MKNSCFVVNKSVFSSSKALVIAELGTGHGGDSGKAKELIAAAAAAGADCVKFQIVYADEILHPNTGLVALPGGNIRLYDRFKALEMPPAFFAECKKEAEKRGILFLCTPFGHKSAEELYDLRPEFIKIASPELNYTSLLEKTAGFGLPALLSSGVSRLSDIEEALAVFQGAVPSVCLLHCVTSYPAPETDYNLRVLESLARVFGTAVGLSDHSLDPVLVPVLSLAMGGCVVEKHFCLSRNDPGLDDPIALPPEDFTVMVKALREAETMKKEDIIGKMAGIYGAEKVEKVLGSGVKTLAPSEKANYSRTNRSIHALCELKAGKTIEKGDFAVLRTEKILRPGVSPSFEKLLPGRVLRRTVPAGEGITWEDI